MLAAAEDPVRSADVDFMVLGTCQRVSGRHARTYQKAQFVQAVNGKRRTQECSAAVSGLWPPRQTKACALYGPLLRTEEGSVTLIERSKPSAKFDSWRRRSSWEMSVMYWAAGRTLVRWGGRGEAGMPKMYRSTGALTSHAGLMTTVSSAR